MSMATKKTDFEGSMKRLEEIVSKLENGEATLEESLKLFEEGSALARGCAAYLDKAEQRVLKLGLDGEETPLEEN